MACPWNSSAHTPPAKHCVSVSEVDSTINHKGVTIEYLSICTHIGMIGRAPFDILPHISQIEYQTKQTSTENLVEVGFEPTT